MNIHELRKIVNQTISENRNHQKTNARKKVLKKIISETLRVLTEDQEFYKSQSETSESGQSPYIYKPKHNPLDDKKGNPKDPEDSLEHGWIAGYLMWAESQQKREDVTKNSIKLMDSDSITADFNSSNNTEYEKVWNKAGNIINRQRDKSKGDAVAGKQTMAQYDLTTPAGVVNMFQQLDQAQAVNVQAALYNGKNDGDGNSDVVKASVLGAECKSMKATQTFIDAGQSIAFPLSQIKPFLQYLEGDGKTFTAGTPITVSGSFIVDGHHRWSGMYCINPSAKIKGINLDFSNISGASKEDAEKTLAQTQLAVGSMVEPGTALPGKGGDPALNILNPSADIKVMIQDVYSSKKGEMGPILTDDFISKVIAKASAIEAIISKLNAYGSESAAKLEGNKTDINTVRDAIIDLATANLELLRSQSTSPIGSNPSDLPRELMPQLDHPTIGGDQGLNSIRNNLNQGRLDVVPESIDIRRWNKLAGILKD